MLSYHSQDGDMSIVVRTENCEHTRYRVTHTRKNRVFTLLRK